METRKITVSNTKTQETKVVETNATTLGELKEAFDNAGIDYTDMAFYEGLTRVELLDDASALPHDVVYKGTVTNDLVIMLTNMKGKIASGMCTRKEVYEYIKENDLAKEAHAKFGKNYTNVSTAELIEWLSVDDNEEEKCHCNKCYCDKEDNETIELNVTSTNDVFHFVASCLRSIAKLLDNTSEVFSEKEKEEKKSPYTQKELDEMTNWLKGC